MMETIFSLSFLLTGPFWLMMIVAPRWSWSRRIIGSPYIILPAALLYAVLVVPVMGEALPLLASPTLESIAGLLGSEAGATIGWIHFLAFDLFVGRWAYLDAQERQISHWLAAPALFFILMLGPLGFCLYLLIRELVKRRRR
jgi:hypothetical protein